MVKPIFAMMVRRMTVGKGLDEGFAGLGGIFLRGVWWWLYGGN